MIFKAFEIAVDGYSGLVDKSGRTYIYHPISVALKVMKYGREYEAAALLHDVIEDSEYSAEDLIKAGMPGSVVNAVVVLTKKPGDNYLDFIRRVKDSGDDIAIKVKMADLMDNTDPDRGYVLPKAMAKRYAKAKAILRGE